MGLMVLMVTIFKLCVGDVLTSKVETTTVKNIRCIFPLQEVGILEFSIHKEILYGY